MICLKKAAVKISSLKPGMILADDIKHYYTGVTLLSAGTQLNHKHLGALELFIVELKEWTAAVTCRV